MTRGQFARMKILQRLHVRTYMKLQHKKNPLSFYKWLVGFTDGDGCFTIYKQGNKWSLIYKLSQKDTNIQQLYYIKNIQKVGHITKENTGMCSFRIRNKEHLKDVIFPIFDSYNQRTVKYYDYHIIKQAYNIQSDNSIEKEELNLKVQQKQLKRLLT